METALVGVVGTLIVVLLSINTKRLGSVDRKIDGVVKDVSETNGSVRELKIWSNMHEKQDDERFKDIKKDLGIVSKKVDTLHE